MKQIEKFIKNYLTIEKIGIGITLLFLLLLFFSQRHDYRFNGKVSMNDTTAPVTQLELDDGAINQQIRWVADVDHINVMLQNNGKTDETIEVTLLREDQSSVSKQQIVVPKAQGKQSVEILLQTDEGGEPLGEEKLMCLRIEKLNKKSHIVFYTQPKEIYDSAYGTEILGTDKQLRMDITFSMTETYTLLYVLTGILMIAGVCIFFCKKQLKVERLFLVILLSAGITLAFSNPACQECDGYEHLLRSMDVSYGNVLSPFVQLTHDSGELKLPKNFETLQLDDRISPNSSYSSFCYQTQTREAFSKEGVVVSSGEGVNSLFYLPQALGLFIGRNLGLSVYLTIGLARVFNLLCYAILLFFAVKKMPYAKTLFAVIALTPIAVYQAASLSQDAALNGFCMLFIATCLSYAYDTKKKELGKKEAVTLGVLLTIVFLCKYIYAVLGLLVFLIPKERFRSTKAYWKNFALALLPLIIAVIFISFGVTDSVAQTQAVDGAGQTQLEILKGNPMFFVVVLVKTIESKLGMWIAGFATYGWLNYPLGLLVYLVPALVVVTAMLAPDRMRQNKKSSDSALLLGTFFAIVCMLMLALYIGDGRINPVGASVAEGIQGRYFVPILFLPFFALASPRVENGILHFSNKVLGIEMLMLSYSVSQLVEYCY